MLELAVMSLRGAAAVLVLLVVVGGLPRIVQLGLALVFGLWSATVATVPVDVSWALALRELVLGAALGIAAAVPLVAVATAGRLVDLAATRRPDTGPYSALFGLLAAAVYVGIDGHVATVTAIAQSHAQLDTLQPRVLDTLGRLVAVAVQLAIPWLVTAAVVEIALGVGVRLAARAGAFSPWAAAVPAALVMMTAALVATLAVVIAAIFRGAL